MEKENRKPDQLELLIHSGMKAIGAVFVVSVFLALNLIFPIPPVSFLKEDPVTQWFFTASGLPIVFWVLLIFFFVLFYVMSRHRAGR